MTLLSSLLRLSVAAALFSRSTATEIDAPAILVATAIKPVRLSPFEVRDEGDVGYQASNTTSGSRLNSRLIDTPAAISPFTAEFLSDIAATNLQEMLSYATNVEAEVEDATAGFNNPAGRDATGGDYRFRVRGIVAGAARDFVDSSIPTDLYNIERADIASGPNSILFGLGSAGGTVALSGKRADLRRSRASLKTQSGSWSQERYETDFNQVLIPQRVALRVLGVYQDSAGWRKWDLSEQRRLTGALTVRLTSATVLRASAETGQTANSLTMGWNAADLITAWNAAGRPVADGAAVPGTTRFATGTNRFVFSDNDGTVTNLRGELQSDSRFSSVTLVTPALTPYGYNLIGPGGLRHQDLASHQAQIEQQFGRDLVLEVAYFHNHTDVLANGVNFAGGGIALQGDPNLTVTAPDGSGRSVRNPHAGELFMEADWFRDTLATTNDVARVSAAWDVELGRWFGRHRVAGLLENARQDRLRRWKNEILVDEKNVPITNPANPEGGQNVVRRRHYFAEGDFNNYYSSDGRISVPTYVFNGRQMTTNYTSRTKGNTQTRQDIGSVMLASQSFWWHDRIVTTVGYRVDQITYRNANEARVTNVNDPRVLARQTILNEWDFDGTQSTSHYRPTTFTAGAVAHATKRISLFANYSKNNGAPRFDRTVLPHGDVPPPTDGNGRDFGVMLDLSGDGRSFVRATYFSTAQINDASIIPDGATVKTSDALGGDNLITILDALLTAGKISRAHYDTQAVSYNAATIDVFTKGVELEFVANPTRNLTLRLGYSYSDRRRDNYFKEVYAFFDPKFVEWRGLAVGTPALLATIDREIATVTSELAAQYERQNSPFATRPHKANATVRHKFSEGRLKGVFVGGALRFQGRNYISQNQATGREYWGNATLFADAFLGHRVRLPWSKAAISLQLNVKNLTNSYLAGIGRYNDGYDGIRRIYLNEPRSYRLTTSVDF